MCSDFLISGRFNFCKDLLGGHFNFSASPPKLLKFSAPGENRHEEGAEMFIPLPLRVKRELFSSGAETYLVQFHLGQIQSGHMPFMPLR